MTELADSLQENPLNTNITIVLQKWGLNADYRLQRWYENKDNNSKVHIVILKDEGLLITNRTQFNTVMEDLNTKYIEDEMTATLKLGELYLAPYEKAVLSSLEFIVEELYSEEEEELVSYNKNTVTTNSRSRLDVVVPVNDRSYAKGINKTKRRIRIKGDPSNTIYDSVVIDFSMIASASIAAENDMPCIRLFNAVMFHNPFHYPKLLMKRLEDFTNFFKRLWLPYYVFREIQYGLVYLNTLGKGDSPYITPKGIIDSDYKCARIQTSSFAMEYGSSSTQQLNTFLVGPFINSKSVEEEIEQLIEWSKDENRKDGFYGLYDWIKSQKSVTLIILGSTTILDDKTMKKIMDGMELTIKEMKDMSVLVSLSDRNIKTFNLMKNNYISLIENERFKLLEGFVPQKALMSFENIEIFISHCGGNSIYEALYFGKMVIGMPYALDHFKIATSLIDFQVGIPLYTEILDKNNDKVWNATSIVEAIKTLAYSDRKGSPINYKKRAKRAKTLMTSAGGVKRATQIIEMISDIEGDLSWTEVGQHLSCAENDDI
ncbi:hypothetical protein ABK040_007585 [Willaertia magna]